MEDTDGGTRGWNRDGDGDGVWKGDLYGRGERRVNRFFLSTAESWPTVFGVDPLRSSCSRIPLHVCRPGAALPLLILLPLPSPQEVAAQFGTCDKLKIVAGSHRWTRLQVSAYSGQKCISRTVVETKADARGSCDYQPFEVLSSHVFEPRHREPGLYSGCRVSMERHKTTCPLPSCVLRLSRV
uniref:HDC02909 n=1 Tax=Drosophila melanogaster TaxID=7227 RepID=Q6IHA7_DROME|nr:TPA_inf: HDC02909 [Drosophila melanogaster]